MPRTRLHWFTLGILGVLSLGASAGDEKPAPPRAPDEGRTWETNWRSTMTRMSEKEESMGSAAPVAPKAGDAADGNDGRHDFDFLVGRYRIVNERLVGRLEGSTKWETFESTNDARTMLNGLGNMDEYRTEHWPAFVGMTFRFFDPQTRTWSLFWADSTTGVLQPPVVGAFVNGVGTFEGKDVLRGKPILVRFIWSHITGDSARWEQAFSADDGRTWETNWKMTFTRQPATQTAK